MDMGRFAGGVLRLPDAASKAGARTVALSSIVQALLGTSPRVSRFVIPTDSGAEPLPSWGNLLAELQRPAAVSANPWVLAPLGLLMLVMISLEVVA